MDYIKKLTDLFNKLNDNVAYLSKDKSGWAYHQKGNTVSLGDMYFDFQHGSFIKYSTIIKNKEILGKLIDYQYNNLLISFLKIEEGFEVKVYDKFGLLVYKEYFKFFNNINWLGKWRLKHLYPELVLDK